MEEALGEDSDKGVFGQLKDTAADAALAVLKPVAKRAATKAAKWAVDKGPELLEDKVMPAVEEAGGPMGMVAGLAGDGNPAQALLSKLPGIGGGDDDGGDHDAGDGTGKGRRMPIQQAVDVAAPIDIVYDQFTEFEEWPKFMHRLESASQKDDATVEFSEKVWGFRRQWEAEIVEQRPDERIVWESVSGLEHVGVVTFHELAERLTRLEVNIDIDPSGPMEKIARGARFAKRAVRADLKRFKAYVEMHEEDTEGWRGEIQDGDVVTSPEEYEEQEEQEAQAEYEEEPEAEYEDEEPEAEYEDEEPEEPEAEYEDEDEDEEEEEQEAEEEQPRRRTKTAASSRSRSTSRSSSNGSSKSESAAPKRSRSKSSSSRSRGSSNGSSKSTSKSSKSGSSGGRSRSSSSKGSSAKSSSSKSSSSGGRSRSSSSKSSSSGGRSRSSSSKSSGSSSRSRGSSKSGSSGKSRSKATSKS